MARGIILADLQVSTAPQCIQGKAQTIGHFPPLNCSTVSSSHPTGRRHRARRPREWRNGHDCLLTLQRVLKQSAQRVGGDAVQESRPDAARSAPWSCLGGQRGLSSTSATPSGRLGGGAPPPGLTLSCPPPPPWPWPWLYGGGGRSPLSFLRRRNSWAQVLRQLDELLHMLPCCCRELR